MKKKESPKTIYSPFDLLLEKEIEGLKTLRIVFLIFALIAILGCLAGIMLLGTELISATVGWQIGIVVVLQFVSAAYITITIRYRRGLRLAKYIAIASMNGIVILAIYWGRLYSHALGFLPILILPGFFFDWRLPIFTVVTALFPFLLITSVVSPLSLLDMILWPFCLIATGGAAALITRRNRAFVEGLIEKTQKLERAGRELEKSKSLLEVKVRARTKELERLTESLDEQVKRKTEELETERASLEIKVKARTRQLEGLAKSLDEKVKQRTEELQKRLEELEGFHRVTVGRELKMTNLKKEIERLKKELEKQKQLTPKS